MDLETNIQPGNFVPEPRPDILDPQQQLRAKYRGLDPVILKGGPDAPGHISQPGIADRIDAEVMPRVLEQHAAGHPPTPEA